MNHVTQQQTLVQKHSVKYNTMSWRRISIQFYRSHFYAHLVIYHVLVQ